MSEKKRSRGVATLLWKKKQGIDEEVDSLAGIQDLLLQNIQLDALDLLTAEKMACGSRDLFVLIAFLSAAFRRGHLCIEVTKEIIFPDPKLILIAKEKQACDYQDIEKAIQAGFLQVKHVEGVIKEGTRLYFSKAYEEEKRVWQHYKRLKESSCENFIEADFDRSKLNAEQVQAALQAYKSTLSCIYGGPGTGKTYTAGIFLKGYLKSYPQERKQQLRIALAGPTGKSVANLEKSIQRALGDDFEYNKKYFEIKTLHALLGMRRFATQPQNVPPALLAYDLLIVDETSMVDVSLMGQLLSRIPKGAKIVFLGDPHQLPSVGPGELFSRFVELEPAGALTKCERTDLQGILQLASHVKNGAEDEAMALLLEGGREKNGSVCFHPVEHDEGLQELFLKEKERFAAEYHAILTKETDPEERLFSLPRFRLLSPLQDGPWGVKAMNEQFYNACEPILIVQNDYQLNLMNGEIGLLDKKCAYFEAKEGEKLWRVPAILLSHYERAYALSVHKSQGSEFEHVILFLPPGSEVFGRKMLYTAITRAKKKLEIFSSPEILRACIRNECRRLSSLSL